MPELRTYNRKRNFKKTSEPKGTREKNFARDFMVHMHDARKLHYDVRLQWKGVLLCWAVPKGPSYDPHDKRLAVRTEDHPVAYKAFEGIIPEKNYGAGPSLIWDAGTWRPLVANVDEALKKGKLKVYFRGVRLRGIWNLVRMHGRGKENWLMIKEDDKYATTHWSIENHLSSVATGRTVEEMTENPDVVDHYEGESGEDNDELSEIENDSSLISAVERKEWAPQMATLTKHPPRQMDDWVVEKKYDGYRLVAIKKEGAVAMVTRNGLDWSDKFPALVREILRLPVKDLILDGEVVAFTQGSENESFQALQRYFKKPDGIELRYVLFDVLSADGVDLRKQPLRFRRNFLEKLFKKLNAEKLTLSEITEWSTSLFSQTCQSKREGLMLKAKDSTYIHGRSKKWLKLKCGTREEFIVVGWTEPQGSRVHFGALLLAEEVRGELQYRGKVGTGFDAKLLKSTLKKLNSIAIDECPIADCKEAPAAHWVKPYYYAEVRYGEMNESKRLRQPVFLGLRDDKFYEQKTADKKSTTISKAKARKIGVRITSPGKVLFEDEQITKADLLSYYSTVFDEFKKLGANRPLSLVRCPDGADESCFFQKHMESSGAHPPQLKIQTKHSTGDYVYIKTFDDLATMVQMGSLELHGWNCSVKDTDHPQFVVWDLDPGEGVKFSTITQTAHLIRLVLEKKGYDTFVRTSGGKGLHVLAPIEKMSWAEAKEFSKSIGEMLVEAEPDTYLITSKKSIRKKKIFIDYLRNSKSATSILNFSTRARPGAPVSFPLFWKEVNDKLNPMNYTIKTAGQLLAKRKTDPWEDFYKQLRK